MSVDKRLTDFTELTAPASGDLLYVVDVSDTTHSAQGTSKKATVSNVRGWPQTAAEAAAGVTPTNYQYEPGNVLRYGATGDGVTDDTSAIQNAILVAETTNFTSPSIYIPAGTYNVTNDVFTSGSSETGIMFHGDGPTSTTLELQTDGTNQVHFFDNSGAQTYRHTFRDIRFKGADQTYCNGFRLNDSAGWEKQFKWLNCRFEDINVVLATTGSTNADECTFIACEWNPVTILLDVNNAQSMLHNFIGCRGIVEGTVWTLGASGGGEFHYIGGSLIHSPSGSDAYLIDGSAGPATSVQTGHFSFNNARLEMRGQYSKLVNWPVSDGTNRARVVRITFDKCNLATANQGSGATRSNAVVIGENKTVTFRSCIMPEVATGTVDDYGYTITADNSGAPGVASPGMIVFDGCTVQDGLAGLCTVTNTYGVFNAFNNVSSDVDGDAEREAVNFTKGMEAAVAGNCFAPVKTLFLKRNLWPYSDGASGFNSEYTAVIPAGSILTRATIFKPSGGTASALCEYHIGTSDKVTSYITTTNARQDAEHSATTQLNIAQFSSDTTIRLWLTEDTVNTATGQLTGGYAFVEYI